MIIKQRLLDTFLTMVQVDSPSKCEKPMADWLMNYLQSRGISCELDDASAQYGGNSGNIVAHIPGTPGSVPLCFAAHTDQISPCNGVRPQVEGNIVRSDGTTTLGADDKGGIAAVLEAQEAIREEGVPHRDIYLLFTATEEAGMLGAKHLDYSRLPCKDIVVMDAVGPASVIAYQAPAQQSIRCTFQGKKAHAGLEPEKGINAVVVAAEAISRMNIGRIDPMTTSNIGRIEGGDATNVVTDRVSFTAEIRAHDPAQMAAQLAHMKSCCEDAAAKFGAVCEFQSEQAYPAFSLERNAPLFQMTVRAMEQLSIQPDPIIIGGGSDANVLAGQGYRSVILGLGMYNVHTVEEYLNVDDLYQAAQVVRLLMQV